MKTTNALFTIKNVTGLLFWVGICYLVAWTGALVSPGMGSSEWYQSLNKPAWNPPDWVFGPVWTLLYTLMGIAAWHIWRTYGFKNARPALVMFLIQLLLNGLWSQLFFGMESPGWAFVEIFFLLGAIIVTTILFFRKSSFSGWLMIPYVLWTTFATFLNGVIWLMN